MGDAEDGPGSQGYAPKPQDASSPSVTIPIAWTTIVTEYSVQSQRLNTPMRISRSQDMATIYRLNMVIPVWREELPHLIAALESIAIEIDRYGPAQGIDSAEGIETPASAARPEGQEPDGEADAPKQP